MAAAPPPHTFRYALIGCGATIAPTHLKALQQMPAARIAGMCDIDPARGKPRAEELGCEFFTDHRQMLARVKPDIAVVTTPHPSHAPIGVDCLENGAHVVVEKPMADEVAQADRLIAAAGAAGRVLAVNFQQRFKPSIERAKALIDAGMVGPLVRVLVVEPWLRTKAYYRMSSWRGTWVGEGGAVLLNQSPHTLDLLCYLAGPPRKVWGWARTLFHDIECEDTFQAMLEYPNGAPGYIAASTVEAGVERRIQIVGQNGAIELTGEQLTAMRFTPSLNEHMANSPEAFSAPQAAVETFDIPGDGGGHLAVHRDMQAAILEGRPPRAGGSSGLMSLELANAINLSSRREHPITLPIDRDEYSRLLAELRGGKRHPS